VAAGVPGGGVGRGAETRSGVRSTAESTRSPNTLGNYASVESQMTADHGIPAVYESRTLEALGR